MSDSGKIKELGLMYYASLISEKRIAIVGGGPSIEDISSFDVVVHVNDHYESSLGQVDIIYSCCSTGDPVDLFRLPQVQALKFMWLDLSSFNFVLWRRFCTRHNIPVGTYARRRFVGSDSDWLSTLQRAWDILPLTGVVALAHVLNFNPKSVFVTGMDLYYDEELNAYPARRHDFDLVKHAQYLRSLDESVVSFDGRLRHVLYDKTVKVNGLQD